jgi:CheY-like chemotaxis protein/anti-sigma regulatory factor (Ser/Thr protein kinase)
MADPGQLEQVLMNLVVNARDALPKGGKITVSTEGVEVREDQAGRHDPLPQGRCARISVRDNGIGMEEAVLARIFDPFFTTKEQGKGTGLGLAMAYGIMKQSQGAIRVESTLGEGSVFHLYLPCIADEDPATGEVHAAGGLVGGSETILVVEDDERLRDMVVRILGRAGYSLLAAEGGQDALDLLARKQAPVHLLLTDVVMPGMSGRDLADEVAVLRPEIRILFMSGYTDDMLSVHGVLKPGIELIQKPFTPAELTQRIRHLLDQPRAHL